MVVRQPTGATYHYRCVGCGLAAEVSGGVDGGWIAQVQTVYCRKCGRLIDIATRYFELPGKDSGDPTMLSKCPICQTADHAPWNEGEPCPRCGGQIVNEGLASNWD